MANSSARFLSRIGWILSGPGEEDLMLRISDLIFTVSKLTVGISLCLQLYAQVSALLNI